MNVFEAVKQSVTTRQAAEHYGIRVGRNGMCACPFHDDKNPSMKVDWRFHCFGCQADGDVIDFVSRLEAVSPKEAALMLAQAFSIPYEDKEPPHRNQRKPRQEPPEQRFRRMERYCFRVLCDYRNLLRRWKRDYAPKTPEEEWHPLFVEALQKQSHVEYLLDVLLFSDIGERAALIVRAKPCLPLWSFSLIRKTELWKTNKPPAMQVSQHCFSLQKKTSGGIINVGSPTALIYTGGIHMDNNSLSHTKWNCKYHIVFAPKYRRKVAYGKIKQDIADILSMLCKRKGVKIVEAEICPDHVHMLVEIPPSISVSYFVGYLKGKSTLMIFERHANLKYKYGNRHFWCRGYYVDTVGKNAKKIQEYIANQLQDDLEYDQMTLKEYIDPFTGEPVKRNK